MILFGALHAKVFNKPYLTEQSIQHVLPYSTRKINHYGYSSVLLITSYRPFILSASRMRKDCHDIVMAVFFEGCIMY